MRDHRPIIGDLIEEYREVVRPARGPARAALWFVGQLLSLVRPWMWGLLLGIALGWIRLRTDSVWPGVIAHGFYNAVGITVIYLQLAY